MSIGNYTPEERAHAKLLLISAKGIIADPKHWTQFEFARTEYGEGTHSTSDNATCWCSLGALTKASEQANLPSIAPRVLATKLLTRNAKAGNVPSTNDYGTHQEVMQMFDGAIADA
jgi:hypothetical protein